MKSQRGNTAASPIRAVAVLEAIAATDDAVFAVDSSQRIVYWSARAEKLLGHPASAVLGCPCHEIVRGERSAGSAAPSAFAFCAPDCPTIRATREGRGVPAYDLCAPTADDRRVWLNVTIIPGTSELFGEPLAIHLCRDVTERRRAELLAQRVTSAVRTFQEDARASDEPAPPPGDGAPALTPRERDTLRCLARGDDSQRAARSLGISAGSFRNHVSSLMRKLDVRTRLEAVLRANRLGLLGR